MTLKSIQQKYLGRSNEFYAEHYAQFFFVGMIILFLFVLGAFFVYYEVYHRPLPSFTAYKPNGQRMQLTAFDEPNLLPDTILSWASKAATVAYTLDFVNYNQQIAAARPYFTANGWVGFRNSIQSLIDTVRQNQIFIYSVVSGQPVISNQGPLGGYDYVWRVQIPFLVTYVSANTTTERNFYVILTIVRVPTTDNPAGIGIDQFLMVG